ncbi:shikimate dehydrogenase [Macrococcus capreoli]|uniref:shikimate dehydrogenase n=1 Tax=Macrococcus capreoli TaxID=2982690 RepID=UPI0021D60A6A|nr:shikimate dehydrogenase [Macrococcus sp. TMW 2.2395]MCU7557189.1 shikimate dehydrogenase [Macrococcus sp. TMW 2.2395]
MNFAVIGHPISHSLSPVMHHANFKALWRDDEYCALNIEPKHFHHIKDIIAEKALDGFNVTIPFKVDIMQYCDEIDTAAQMIGAVNTVHIKNGQWIGYNTDGIGYLFSIQEHLKDNMNVLILGAGGASRAISYTLVQHHRVTVANRTVSRVQSWPFEVACKTYDQLDDLSVYDLVINTTPVGMTGYEDTSLIACDQLKASCIVSDIIYTPETTALLKDAQQHQLNTINGLGMFVMQGARSFEIWTGQVANVQAMTEAVTTALKGRK